MGEVPHVSRLNNTIKAFVLLGQYMISNDDQWMRCKIQASQANSWFTLDNIDDMMNGFAKQYCDEDKLINWIKSYSIPERSRRVGLIFAGNLPFVGFHDLLATIISGHQAVIRLSSKDDVIPPYLIRKLIEFEPSLDGKIQIVSKLKDIDAVIATGSNNTSRYFHSYFKHIPHIIRKNRQGVAVLTGDENEQDLNLLLHDILGFFGMGCRSISKLYLLKGYQLDTLFNLLNQKGDMLLHPKYKSNYDYNFALWTLNGNPFLQTASILLREDRAIASRIASLHYHHYANLQQIEQEIKQNSDQIQCIVARQNILKDLSVIDFGNAQNPGLNDYADQVDTLQFLSELT